MKYIRTKDGRIIKIGEQTDVDYKKGTFEIHNKAGIVASYEPIDVLKQADTIEKLSDCFVAYKKGYGEPIVGSMKDKDKLRYGEIKMAIRLAISTGLCTKEECWLKLAIWTDKGLIYVAKMNKKGEFELL